MQRERGINQNEQKRQLFEAVLFSISFMRYRNRRVRRRFNDRSWIANLANRRKNFDFLWETLEWVFRRCSALQIVALYQSHLRFFEVTMLVLGQYLTSMRALINNPQFRRIIEDYQDMVGK